MNKQRTPLLLKLESVLEKYTPHIILILCLFTLLAFIFTVNSYGFVPFDDCLRHSAKAVSGKPWNQILVVRPEYHDHNAGWHSMLEWVHHHFQADVPQLIGFSVIFLFLCASMPMLLRMKRPEAWMAGLLFFGTIYFGNFSRLFYGRPYIFALGGTILLLDLWTGTNAKEKPQPAQVAGLIITTTLLFTLMTYIHGSFYLYIIPVGTFLLAGQWRKFLWLLPCLGAGAFLGMLLTGDLAGFWHSQLLHLNMIARHKIETRYLASELWPHPGFSGYIVPITLFLVLRYLRKQTIAPLWKDPVFILLVTMGILGFRVARFWLDFGIPAVMLWVARELQSIFEQYTGENSLRRLALAGGVCASFFLMLSANIGDRWDNNYEGCGRPFPKADDPKLQGWFPDNGGIIYNNNMTFFYNTFAANPHANWRYVLGFEPNIMPDDDLKIYRTIQKENNWDALQPWVDKMRPEDRMVIYGNKPETDELEWLEAFPGVWFGRIATAKATPETPTL